MAWWESGKCSAQVGVLDHLSPRSCWTSLGISLQRSPRGSPHHWSTCTCRITRLVPFLPTPLSPPPISRGSFSGRKSLQPCLHPLTAHRIVDKQLRPGGAAGRETVGVESGYSRPEYTAGPHKPMPPQSLRVSIPSQAAMARRFVSGHQKH